MMISHFFTIALIINVLNGKVFTEDYNKNVDFDTKGNLTRAVSKSSIPQWHDLECEVSLLEYSFVKKRLHIYIYSFIHINIINFKPGHR